MLYKQHLMQYYVIYSFKRCSSSKQCLIFSAVVESLTNFFCVLFNCRNTKKIIGYLGNEVSANLIPHHVNLSRVSTEDYQLMTSIIRDVMENDYPRLGLDSCDIKEELNKVGLQYTEHAVNYLLDLPVNISKYDRFYHPVSYLSWLIFL